MSKLHVSKDLSLPLDAVTMTFAILAVRGAGKTYWALVMAEEMVKNDLQMVFVDPVGVAWGLRATSDGKFQGLPVVILGGERGDVPLEPDSGEVIADWVVESGRSCVLDLSHMRKGEQVRFMIGFAEKLFLNKKKARVKEPIHIFLDEADTFAPQKPMNKSGEPRMLGAVEDLVKKGRAQGIGCTMATQRAAVLNKNVLTQIESLICLRTISPQDRAAIQGWVDIYGTEDELEEFESSVASLPQGEAYFWSPGWLKVFKRVKARTRDTFDSSSTPKVGAKRATPKSLGPIEIKELQGQLSDAIERKKQEDPTHLRNELSKAKIALLDRDKDIEHLKREVGILNEDVANYSSVIQKEQEERQKVSQTLTDEEVSAIKGVSVEVARTSEQLVEILKSNLDMLTEIRNRLDQKMFMAKTAPLATPPKRRVPVVARPSVKPTKEPQRSMKASAEWNELSRCCQAILKVLSQKSPCTVQQLAILTHYAVGSGNFSNNLSTLKVNGYMDGDRTAYTLTPEGSRVIPAGVVHALPVGSELIEHWVAKLSRASGAILRELCAAWPKTLTKEQIAEKTGYTVDSGNFSNALSVLKVLELITKPDKDTRRASDTFFN